MMKHRVHAIAAIVAISCIITFFTSTIVVELFGTEEWLPWVKGMIVYPGLFILVPAIAITGASGFLLSKKRTGSLLTAKKKRMPFIAANGLFILIPAAIYLDHLATAGTIDTTFYVVQVVELIAGAVNISLMGINIRDGLRMTGRLK